MDHQFNSATIAVNSLYSSRKKRSRPLMEDFGKFRPSCNSYFLSPPTKTMSEPSSSITSTSTHSESFQTRKRSRESSSSSLSPFDMSEFTDAYRRVEETIAFPAIVFPSEYDFEDVSSDDDNNSLSVFSMTTARGNDNDDDNDDDEYGNYQPRKRFRGLTRSYRSSSLTELALLTSSSNRNGSNGSLAWWFFFSLWRALAHCWSR
jgi:hypothetical protein